MLYAEINWPGPAVALEPVAVLTSLAMNSVMCAG